MNLNFLKFNRYCNDYPAYRLHYSAKKNVKRLDDHWHRTARVLFTDNEDIRTHTLLLDTIVTVCQLVIDLSEFFMISGHRTLGTDAKASYILKILGYAKNNTTGGVRVTSELCCSLN